MEKGVTIFSFTGIIATFLRKGMIITAIFSLMSLVFLQGCIKNEKTEVFSLKPVEAEKWYEQPMRIAALQYNPK